MKSTSNIALVSKKERAAYGLYFGGQNMIYLFVMNFIQNYFTDVAGIAAGSVAVIILIARLWDAVNDPMFGIIVDKSRLKGGRYKPWLRIAAFILPIFTVLIFCVPSTLPLSLKTTLCALIYIVWGMAYTVCDIPIFSLVTAMTGDVQERTRLIARGRIFSFLGIALVTLSTVPLTNAIGGATGNPPSAWLIAAAVFSIAAFFLMLPISKAANERTIDQSSAPITLRAMLSYLRSNKYLLIFYGAIIVSSFTNTTTVLPLYFARVNLRDDNLFTLIVVVSMIGAPLVSACLPRLTKRFDKFQIFMAGMLITIAVSVIMYFVGYEGSKFAAFLVLSFIRGIGLSCTTVMMFMFAADCAEYGAYKSGKRAEGLTFSIQTFATKMTGAVSGFMAMGLLGWLFHYQSSYYLDGALILPEQPLTAINGIWFMYSVFPAVGALAAFFILLFFYKLRDKSAQLMSDINAGVISREEGERLLEDLRAKEKKQ
ncbi:MAG: glycoside-pentoside-hexuronide (GPH):cation symporter [Clostridiales bacterium]|jgi:sugar (glycoside-pentoside-hexuronide) transporter|nr:glycoside-pentoside-hexuronide (GPH):cation symporter [Clostridiales bacterium]